MPTEAETTWVITRRDGVSTMHRNPHARCEVNFSRDVTVDEWTAERQLLTKDSRPCEFCLKEGWG